MCGLTPQYEGLERLQQAYGDRRARRLPRARQDASTDALLSAPARGPGTAAERRARVEATLDTICRDRGPPQVYRFLMHPADGADSTISAEAALSTEQGFDVGRHSARSCAGSARSWAR
ncbi:hypothetical protein SMICM304S_11515 [Streptomyces microflavus]